MRTAMKAGWFLLLFFFWACSKSAPPPPIPGEGGAGNPGNQARPASPRRPAPLVAGVSPGEGRPASEADALPPGEGGGGGTIRLEPGGGERRLPWVVFTWPAAEDGVQKKLRLTTRPAGTGAWPWITLEAWIPARKGLGEWIGHRVAVNRLKYQDGPGLAPWPRAGECYLVLRKFTPAKILVDLHLELLDLVQGVKRVVTGSLEAVKSAGPPANRAGSGKTKKGKSAAQGEAGRKGK